MYEHIANMTADKERMPPLTPKDSSLKKRKMSSLSSDHSEQTGSSFSEQVKDETQLLADLRCWNCRGTPTEVCHVFAKGDYLLVSTLNFFTFFQQPGR